MSNLMVIAVSKNLGGLFMNLKILLALIFALLLSTAVQAFPAQGDDVKFNLVETSVVLGKVYSGTYEEQITALDVTQDSFSLLNTLSIDGMLKAAHSTETGKASTLVTKAKIEDILQNCVSDGGKLETLQTGAGPIETCAETVSNVHEIGTVWLGLVPFGTVQSDLFLRDSNISLQLYLQSYHNGGDR